MSIIKFAGTGVTAISGKQGGTVFTAAGSAGPFARNWSKSVNPRTTKQSLVRNIFSAWMNNFANLSPTQIEAWNQAAADNNAFSLRVNSFGDTRHITGQQLYQRINHLMTSIGLAPFTDVPISDIPSDLIPIDLTVNPVGPSMTLLLYSPVSGTPVIIPANTYILVYATPQMSPGRRVFTNDMYRLIQLFAPGLANPLDIVNDYQLTFGTLVANHIASCSIQVITTDATPSTPGTVFSRFRPVSKFKSY